MMIKDQTLQNSEYAPDHAALLEQAAEWLLLMEEQPLTPEQQQAFEQWKNTSPQHQKIWRRAEKIRQKLYGHARQVPSVLARNILAQQADASPWMGKLVLLLAGSTLLGFGVYTAQQQAWLADYRTGYAEQQNIRLEDGTHISLNSKTAIDVDYGAGERRIILHFGEIYVETGKDSGRRPFKVLNPHGEMLALGTAFNVQKHTDHTLLSVTEHAVQVTTGQSRQQQAIQAGQQISFNPQQLYPSQPLQFEQLTWRKGLVTVNRISVQDFARIIEQHYGVTVKIATSGSASLGSESRLSAVEISGSYPINDLERLIVLLENTYPVKVDKSFLGRKLVITVRS